MQDLQFDDMHLFARVAELGTLGELEGGFACVPVSAVPAGARHRPPKIRACIGYRAEWFSTTPAASTKKR